MHCGKSKGTFISTLSEMFIHGTIQMQICLMTDSDMALKSVIIFYSHGECEACHTDFFGDVPQAPKTATGLLVCTV